MRMSHERALDALFARCKAYERVPFGDEMQQDLARASQRLTHARYLQEALNHKFCLVASGDYPSTHKVSEALAIGGAGGCIPVFVVPGPSSVPLSQRLARWLPYTRWLDYCDVAYLLEEHSVVHNVDSIVAQLRAVGAADARRMHRRLRRVRAAFVFRRGSTLKDPSAPQYILNEACHAAHRFATKSVGPEVAGGEHARCLLS
eukprot:5244712-Prymnesium_polylepis.1